MSTMIQIRHVPDVTHRKLKARAALEGLSLSDFLLREVQALVDRPSLPELQARLAARAPVKTRVSAAKAVRAERDSR
jgi:plasmid stability protein